MKAFLLLSVVYLGAWLLTACPTPPGPGPAPVTPPDADAAPTMPEDASAPIVPSTPCEAACDALTRLCTSQDADCVPTLAHVESAREIRNKRTGRALTCLDVASAQSAADVLAIGWPCGKQ